MKQPVVFALACAVVVLVQAPGHLTAQRASEDQLLAHLQQRDTAFHASLGLAARYRDEQRTSEAIHMLDGAKDILWLEQRQPQDGRAMPLPGRGAILRVGGDVPEPRRTRNVVPRYPESVSNGQAGAVLVEFVIDQTGKVESARVLRSSPLFDAAALAAVRQWRYEPTLLAGSAVSVVTSATLGFWPQ